MFAVKKKTKKQTNSHPPPKNQKEKNKNKNRNNSVYVFSLNFDPQLSQTLINILTTISWSLHFPVLNKLFFLSLFLFACKLCFHSYFSYSTTFKCIHNKVIIRYFYFYMIYFRAQHWVTKMLLRISPYAPFMNP